eukprot:TRINITY_DN10374_c0_g1_i1.p1 TRINITY_DN10374_c0_g1~~TRINITY_DN10374_c0_g1_i1.p1  ORF type:complete len:1481 (-),score=517.39 TRINITY_DN10374_c0_g1_i1:693-4844(-)
MLNGARLNGAKHALMLMPVTLLDQWVREAKVWCPDWPVYTYYGSPAQRAAALRQVSRPEGGILLTSYSMLGGAECLYDVGVCEAESPPPKRKPGRQPLAKAAAAGKPAAKRQKLEDGGAAPRCASSAAGKDLKTDPVPVERRPWDVVVCDEAHRMKNISTLLGKSLRHVRSRSRLLLTGTPVQNALQDLWALMDFAQPGLLGNHATFVKRFSDPIDRGTLRGANPFQVELKRHLSVQLRDLMRPHLLRRTKLSTGLVGEADEYDVAMEEVLAEEGEDTEALVKMLPPKRETIVWLMPTEEQTALYRKVLEKSDVVREAASKSKMSLEVFRAIGLLKRLCNHPSLIVPMPKQSQWTEFLEEAASAAPAMKCEDAEADSDLAGTAEGDAGAAAADGNEDDARAGRAVEQLARRLPRGNEALLMQSAKLRCLQSLLPSLIARGHRVLVFAHSAKMLDLVQICCLRPHGLRCLRVDGQTEPMTRAEKVRKFQLQGDRFQCMLLTTSVGGVGLNLTGADRVILVDPAWNPAVDAQAVDRAFRIGQEREVRVYRLIMSGLIEDKMFRLQVFKMGLSKTALEANQQASYFTAREIRALFDWTDPAEGETRKLIDAKHGDAALQELVRTASDEDGAGDGWFEDGPAVGLSDFGALFGSLAGERGEREATESDCVDAAAHVSQAQERLGAADEKLQHRQGEREAAEANHERTRKELEVLSGSGLEQSKERRAKAEEAFKEQRARLAPARKSETTAIQQLEKAQRAKGAGLTQQLRASQAADQAQDGHAAALRVFEDACNNARACENALSETICKAEEKLTIADGGLIEVAAERARALQTAFEKLRKPMDTMAIRQAELESAYDDLSQADVQRVQAEEALALAKAANEESSETVQTADAAAKNALAQQLAAEQAQAKAQKSAEAAWESMALHAQIIVEEGVAYSDAFQRAADKQVKMEQIRTIQHAVKSTFRQLASASQSLRKARDAWVKAGAARRKAMQKAAAAAAASGEASRSLAALERDVAAAFEHVEQRRKELHDVEKACADADAERAAAELEETQRRSRKEELKQMLPLVKEAIKVARAAEKEACGERQAVQAECSKTEKAKLRMEEAKRSAVESLQAEVYDARQVELAYQGKKKGVNIQESREAAVAAAKACDDAHATARAAEERLSKAFAEVQTQLAIVDSSGNAVGDEGVVDAPLQTLEAARAAAAQLSTALDTMAIGQAELECADEDLAQADVRLTEAELALASLSSAGSTPDARAAKARRAAEKELRSWEKERQKAEEDQGNAKQKAEEIWADMASVVQVCAEAGYALAESFVRAQGRQSVKMEQVRLAQTGAKSVFRQLSVAATSVRKAREGWVKAAVLRRKAMQRERAAVIAEAEILSGSA